MERLKLWKVEYVVVQCKVDGEFPGDTQTIKMATTDLSLVSATNMIFMELDSRLRVKGSYLKIISITSKGYIEALLP